MEVNAYIDFHFLSATDMRKQEIEELVKGKETFLADFIIYGKYSQLKEDEDRKEVWSEVVQRNYDMHARKFSRLIDGVGEDTEFHQTLMRSYELVNQQYFLPSMRSMQFAGKNIEQKNAKIYNCSFLHIKEKNAFKEVLYLLMCGCGVGFSVQERHVGQLPKINRFYIEPKIVDQLDEKGNKIGWYSDNKNFESYLIKDTVEGWCDAVDRLMGYYFGSNPFPIFDFLAIRPKGTPLKTSGGTAPGHEVFEKSLETINYILASKKDGEQLKPIEVYDILCLEAEAVLSGGIRRSAMICLFDHYDQEMLLAKTGIWWKTQPWRSNSNNSKVLLRKKTNYHTFSEGFKVIKESGSGEPGIFWTNDYDLGTNPCAEITLRHKQFCNLTTINLTKIDNQETLEKVAYAAAFIGTLQATYTDFDPEYLSPDWKRVTEEDALIGVSLTGVTRSIFKDLDFKKAAKVVTQCNQYWSSVFGINACPRNTTMKPEGTGSLTLSLLSLFCPSGIHSPEGEYFIKRARIAKTEPIYKFLMERIPELIEDEIGKEDRMAVLSIPCYAGEGITTKTETVHSFLSRIEYFYSEWILGGHVSGTNTNNISATCYVGEEEWEEVESWSWDNRENYAALSFYPKQDWVHTQLPQEAISFERWKELITLLKPIDFTELHQKVDFVDHVADSVACSGGMCEI